MIAHKGTQTLHTERLILRKFSIDDAADMFNNWANDEKVTKFLTWQPHQSIDATRQLLQGWVAAYDNIKTYNSPIGTTMAVSIIYTKSRNFFRKQYNKNIKYNLLKPYCG